MAGAEAHPARARVHADSHPFQNINEKALPFTALTKPKASCSHIRTLRELLIRSGTKQYIACEVALRNLNNMLKFWMNTTLNCTGNFGWEFVTTIER